MERTFEFVGPALRVVTDDAGAVLPERRFDQEGLISEARGPEGILSTWLPGSVVTVGASLFDSDSVIVDGSPIDTPGPVHADGIAALLHCDLALSGVIALPADATEVSQVLTGWQQDLGGWRRRMDDNLSTLLPGLQRAGRRESVRREIARQAQVDRGLLD